MVIVISQMANSQLVRYVMHDVSSPRFGQQIEELQHEILATTVKDTIVMCEFVLGMHHAHPTHIQEAHTWTLKRKRYG